jgi:hypothetical protein
VSRSRPMPLNRLGILVLTGILCSTAAARPARAAGCHVPDRPVLGTRLSWEQEPSDDLGPTMAALAPPVLTHLPCPGEIPHLLSPTTVPPALVGPASAGLDLRAFSEALRGQESRGHVPPLPARLDRPPRTRELFPNRAVGLSPDGLGRG